MLSLRDTQRAFCSAMLSGDAACMATLISDGGIPAEQRMQIYGNSNRLGFLAAMQATYPVIQQLGGEQWFAQHARQYQLRFPSRSGDLQYVGTRFADYLQAELADTDYEYFADVARLEWAYQEALIAADSTVLEPAALSTVAVDDYEHLTFTPRCALRLIKSSYPILAIWKAHQPDAESVEINLESGPSHVLVIRRDDHVELRELPPASFDLLELFMRGHTLGEAVETIAPHHPGFDLGASLRQLMTLSCFTTFHLRAGFHSSDFIQLSGSTV